MKALLKSKDINRFLSISEADLPPCDLRTIKQLEEKEFRDCIGDDLYGLLKADEIDYSQVDQYQSGEYTQGDKVVYKGLIYQATATTTALPNNVSDWELAPKFSTEIYETLWCSYLGEYLSWVVFRGRLPFMRSPVKGGTIVSLFGSEFNAASDKSYGTLQKTVNIRIGIVFDNMDNWIKDQDNSDLSKYKGIENNDCKSKGKCSCGNSCLSNKKRKYRIRVA